MVSATFSVSMTNTLLMITEHSGGAAISALDVTAVGSGATGHPLTAAFTTNQADEAFICMVGAIANSDVFAPGPGYTERLDPTRGYVEDQFVSVLQTNSGAATAADSTQRWQAIVATFKAATAGAVVAAAVLDESFITVTF